MPCRVGITTDLKKRKKYWEGRVYGLKNWQTHGRHWNKEDAQAEEDLRVENCSAFENRGECYGRAGGGDPDDDCWTVYSFDYTRERRRA